MSVLIKDMEMPTECHGCRWFYFQGTSCTEPKYYLDARCEMVESGQDWYGKDARGGWIGESIEHIPGWAGYNQHKHCVEIGTRASQCPLCELPSVRQELSFKIQDILDYLDTALHPIISPEHWNVYSDLHDMISTLPSAQSEIIRCKDCKWSEKYVPMRKTYYYCREAGLYGRTEDDFCSRAERREEGEE